MVSHSGSVAKIYGGLTGCGRSGNGWMGIAVDSQHLLVRTCIRLYYYSLYYNFSHNLLYYITISLTRMIFSYSLPRRGSSQKDPRTNPPKLVLKLIPF